MSPEELAAVVLDDLVSRGFAVENEPESSARWNGVWLEVKDSRGQIYSILVQHGN